MPVILMVATPSVPNSDLWLYLVFVETRDEQTLIKTSASGKVTKTSIKANYIICDFARIPLPAVDVCDTPAGTAPS